MKQICTKCKKMFSQWQFARNILTSTKHQSWCKSCQKEWRKSNPGFFKNWVKKNKLHYNQWQREHRLKNRQFYYEYFKQIRIAKLLGLKPPSSKKITRSF